MRIISERLKQLRMKQGLTQVQMAEIVGIQQSRIHQFEAGSSTPAPEIFLRYADYFGVSIDYLYGRTDKPEGQLYDGTQISKTSQDEDRAAAFIELCFEPGTAANRRLKAYLLQLMKGDFDE